MKAVVVALLVNLSYQETFPPPNAPPMMPASIKLSYKVSKRANKLRPMRFLPRGIADGSLPVHPERSSPEHSKPDVEVIRNWYIK